MIGNLILVIFITAGIHVQADSRKNYEIYQCSVLRAVGRCRAAFPRWWYNETSRNCEQFIYGGCSGNNNSFLTKEDCMEYCGNGATETEEGTTTTTTTTTTTSTTPSTSTSATTTTTTSTATSTTPKAAIPTLPSAVQPAKPPPEVSSKKQDKKKRKRRSKSRRRKKSKGSSTKKKKKKKKR